MIEQLFSMIQQNSQDAVVKNPAIPNQFNEGVMQTLMSTLTGGLQQEVQKGNVQDVMGLLSGRAVSGGGAGLMQNPIVSSLSQMAVKSITEKFGISNSVAAGVVASVLPSVLSSLISKVSNPNDNSLDFNGIMGDLMAGGGARQQAAPAGFDFNQIGYALADGKLDMNDAMRIAGSFMSGGGQSSQQAQGGGLDLGGLLGGLFKK